MYTVEDILARLQSGENSDDIAQEFADTLNAAIKAKKKEDNKKAVAKRQDLAKIVQANIDFIQKYYPESCLGLDLEITEKDIEAMVDELNQNLIEIVELAAEFSKKEKAKNDDYDSIIAQFFKDNDLK